MPPAGLPDESLEDNQGNPSEGRPVILDPLSGPKGSPLDAKVFDYSTGTPPGWNATTKLPIKVNDPDNVSTGALSTGIGFGANHVIGALPVGRAIFNAGFNDDGIPGEDHEYDLSPPAAPGSVSSNNVNSTRMYIGGGRMLENPGTISDGRPFVPSPYDEGISLLGAGSGGSRDAGAGPAFTGFALKMVTNTGTTDIANGGTIEGSYINRSGGVLTPGQSGFGSSNAASAAPSGPDTPPGEGPVAVPNVANGGGRTFATSEITGGANVSNTDYCGIEADGPFTHVQLVLGPYLTSGHDGPYNAIVATTETGQYDTVDNVCKPRVSGTYYNNLLDGSGRGFIPVTLLGSASMAVDTSAANAGNNIVIKATDVIPLASRARVDAVGAGPMLIFRIYNTAGRTSSVGGTNGYQTFRGQPFYRERHNIREIGVDGVNVLTNLPAAASIADSSPQCYVNFLYATPGRNVLLVGDSTMADAVSGYQSLAYPIRAIRERVTAVPVGFIQMGLSGQFPSAFQPYVEQFLAAYPFTDVFYQYVSGNGWTGIAQDVIDQKQRVDEVIASCQAHGANLFLVNDWVWGSGSASVDYYAKWDEVRAYGEAKCAAGLATLVDTDSIITDRTTDPTKPRMIVGVSADSLHLNTAGSDLLKPAVVAAIEQVWSAATLA